MNPGQLLPQVYDELRKLAAAKMRQEADGHTLNATALVNEAWLKLNAESFSSKSGFFRAAAVAMRRILVDHARRRNMHKRSGQWVRVSLADHVVGGTDGTDLGFDVLLLDTLLERLAVFDARKSRVVELRYFGGLSLEETARVLDVTPRTVDRDWRAARAWLHAQLADGS